MVGVIVLLTVYDKQWISVQYFALFLVVSGTYGAAPIIISWFTNNCMPFFEIRYAQFAVKLT